MGFNPFLPTAAARINVLCIPAGPITPERFAHCVKLLQTEATVKVKFVDSASKPETETDGASGSEDGYISYDFDTGDGSRRPDMFPYETNGRCQLLVGIVDGDRLAPQLGFEPEGNSDTEATDVVSELKTTVEVFANLQVSTSCLLGRKLLVFGGQTQNEPAEGVLFVSADDPTQTLHATMIALSAVVTKGVTRVIDNLKDKPISMLPGSASPMLKRIPSTPVQTGEGSSTPISVSSPTPATAPIEVETQSETSKGRFNVVAGMLLLQSGLWADALKGLSHGAALAQANQDHLWHARALECLVLCMLHLSWRGQGYAVPSVCQTSARSFMLLQQESATTPQASLKALAHLLPSLTDKILDLYTRISNLDLGGFLQDLLRETRIRHVNLLVSIKSSGGVLNEPSLRRVLFPSSERPEIQKNVVGEPVLVNRNNLATVLIETLQASQSSNDLLHSVTILVAISSSLSTLRLDRKHAFYVKQLMQSFIPKLAEARKVGASEAGLHPAAGVTNVNNSASGLAPEMIEGTRAILNVAAGAYGTSLPPIPQSRKQPIPADVEAIQDSVRNWTIEQSCGYALLKLEMLRICVSVCEALPDVEASLHFTSHILRSAKLSLFISRNVNAMLPLISAEEQARQLDSIKRSVDAAPRMGLSPCLAEYWDDFLVRDIQVFEGDAFTKLVAHKSSTLSLRNSGLAETLRDPFIYNPFSKDKSVANDPVLVAGELASFSVVLQNPLEVDVEIDEIRLTGEGCNFEPSQHGVVLGPFTSQAFTLSGTPKESGDLVVTGCRALIRNCYEQDFLVFREDWKAPITTKQLPSRQSIFRIKPTADADQDQAGAGEIVGDPPKPSPFKVKVIPSQPKLVITSSTLPHTSIMLLEGESRTFKLELTNMSREVTADLALITTEDSVTSFLQEALSNKDLGPAEIYEIQHQLAVRPAVEVKSRNRSVPAVKLAPGEKVEHTIVLFGRPGLLNASVLADYAHLGVPSSEVKGTFYTRQVRYPISVTVNASIDIPRCNVLPIHGDFAWNGINTSDTNGVVDPHSTWDPSRFSSWLGTRRGASDFCMLTIDVRNVWPRPLSVEMEVRKSAVETNEEDDQWSEAYMVQETLVPGVVSRLVLLVPRLFIDNPQAPIPNMDKSKQYVVPASKLTAEAEAANRESFWYREELLKHLRAKWTEDSTGRHGEIDLRKGIRLSTRMVDVLKKEHVDISYIVKPLATAKPDASDDASGVVTQTGQSHFRLRIESFATLYVQVHNHTTETLQLLLRLQPGLRHQPHNIALDLSKCFLWTGVLQQALHPQIEPGGVHTAELGILALAEGDYEINASVEEIQSRRRPATTKNSADNPDYSRRRLWYARSPCLIDAV